MATRMIAIPVDSNSFWLHRSVVINGSDCIQHFNFGRLKIIKSKVKFGHMNITIIKMLNLIFRSLISCVSIKMRKTLNGISKLYLF